jgi:ABC-type lipoprotein export system ATPase subunit
MSNILEIRNLTKKYEDAHMKVTALDNVSFTLSKGQDLAVLGPSGSGKTTLLQLVGGLDEMTEGRVVVNGKNLNNFNDQEMSEFRNRTMGFIFQMINLQSFLTAKENVMVPMLILNTPRDEASRKADDLLKKMGMLDRADHLPSQLSGGEQQRVAVARALANDPSLIFADEPTGKLDKINADTIIDMLESISKEKDMSVIMITHDENIAKKFNRIIYLEAGSIKKDIKFKDKK